MFSRYSSLILVKTTDVGAMWLYAVTGDFTKPERLSRCPPPPPARAIEEYDKLVLLRRALFHAELFRLTGRVRTRFCMLQEERSYHQVCVGLPEYLAELSIRIYPA